jgi:hypothetical protein
MISSRHHQNVRIWLVLCDFSILELDLHREIAAIVLLKNDICFTVVVDWLDMDWNSATTGNTPLQWNVIWAKLDLWFSLGSSLTGKLSELDKQGLDAKAWREGSRMLSMTMYLSFNAALCNYDYPAIPYPMSWLLSRVMIETIAGICFSNMTSCAAITLYKRGIHKDLFRLVRKRVLTLTSTPRTPAEADAAIMTLKAASF